MHRAAEFNGSTRAVCSSANFPRLRPLRRLNLHNNDLSRLTKIGNLAQSAIEDINLSRNKIASVPTEVRVHVLA